MMLTRECISTWPKLTWVAKTPRGRRAVHVFHGPMVETRKDWIVEAVWDGDFDAGDFDRTALVFGTGVRCREDRVIFVAAATGVECLWHCEGPDARYVSNSLPALLAAAGLSLRDDYRHYARDTASIETRGLLRYIRTLPTTSADVHMLYFQNLVFDGSSLSPVDKPDNTPAFGAYEDYHAYLMSAAARLQSNIKSPARRSCVSPFVGISSGYDSPAAAVVARAAGCTQAATIRQSNSLWRGSDCGSDIAKILGMSCREHDLRPGAFRRETTVWAAAGRPGGLNLTVFDYPQPLCVFFDGSYGDVVWDRRLHDLREPVGDKEAFLGEFRLWQGLFHCVVPWWGIRRAAEINRLGSLDEMEPWVMNSNYDRPVARRLVEEAGVPRGTFAIRKKNTSSNTYFQWPFAREAQESFASYLRHRGHYVPPRWLVGLIRRIALLDALFYKNVTKRFGVRKGWRPWKALAGSSLLFQWSNSELKRTYERGLEAAGVRQ